MHGQYQSHMHSITKCQWWGIAFTLKHSSSVIPRCFITWYMAIYLQTKLLKQAIFHTLEDILVVNDFQVLTFRSEDLLRVLSTTHRVGSHLCLLHLLAHLVCSILATQNEVVHRLQTEQSQEVPRERRHPSDIQIAGTDTSLQHLLELRCQWEGEFHCGKSVDVPVIEYT
jgi:hypothetical protein